MRPKLSGKILIAIAVIMLGFNSLAKASSESYIQSLSGHIQQGDSCMVVDDKFLNLPLTQWNLLQNISVENIISFELRQDTAMFFYNRSFTCTLNISIKYFTSRDQQIPNEINNIELIVTYDTATGAFYSTIAKHQFKNAFKVVVVVNSITSPEWGNQLPNIFRINNQIFVERKYPFNQMETSPLTIQTAARPENLQARLSTGLCGRQLNISWSAIGGAEEYDLEWIYVDNLDADKAAQIPQAGPTAVNPADVEVWMNFDNTRVTVAATKLLYTISLPYTEGYIFFRVRSVHYLGGTNVRVGGVWNYTDASGTAGINITDHQPNLNWQYTVSFAEEGKRKEVISYFDASLRSRQTVTINNSELVIVEGEEIPVALVGETIYDNMGRPAANILPSPIVASCGLAYQPGFNLNNSQPRAPYSYTDLSLPAPGGIVCNMLAGALNIANGAGNYYSSQNSFLNPFQNNNNHYFTKYVPDAGGYPFSVTQYTADNTGRIRTQGGVGPEFQIGSGHETKYFYSKPLQKDLYRIFGMEVGNVSHYMKNTVMDANGQLSVSYVDASGKTIATALAGKAPENVDPLLSSQNALGTVNQALIKPADFSRDAANLKMQATATFVAATTNDYTLHYSTNAAAVLTTHGTPPLNFCNNCYYDIEILVRNDCGKTVTSVTVPATSPVYTCSATSANMGSLIIPIAKIGEYTVTYTLKLPDQVIREQVDYYVENNSNLKRIQDFFQEELNKVDLSGCFDECTTCRVKLGDPVTFRDKIFAVLIKQMNEKYQMFLPPQEMDQLKQFIFNSPGIQNWITQKYQDLDEQCDELEDDCNPSPCELKLRMLKEDVKPGGQYALYSYAEGSEVYTLLEKNGNVNVIGQIYPTVTSQNTLPILLFKDILGNTLNRRTLSESDFVKHYLNHPEWADELVLRHPEYCSYQWCKDAPGYLPGFPAPASGYNNEQSYIFDEKVEQQVIQGSDAVAQGYFDRNNRDALLDKDPFFNNSGRGTMNSSDLVFITITYRTRFKNDLTNFSDAIGFIVKDQNGARTGKNILDYIFWNLYFKPTDPAATAQQIVDSWDNYNVNSINASCRSLNREWELYKRYYLQLKRKYYQQIKNRLDPSCENCYIGDDVTSGTTCKTPVQSDYTVEFDGNNTTWPFNYYIVYQGGTKPFPDNVIVTLQRNSSCAFGAETIKVRLLKGQMKALIETQRELNTGCSYSITSALCPVETVSRDCIDNYSTVTSVNTSPLFPCPNNNDFSTSYQVVGSSGSSHYIHRTIITHNNPLNQDVVVTVINTYDNGSYYNNTSDDQFTVLMTRGSTTVIKDRIISHNWSWVSYGLWVECSPQTPDPFPASNCRSNPNYQYYRYKTRRFNEYANEGAYTSCFAGDVQPTLAESEQSLRDRAIEDLRILRSNWLQKLRNFVVDENEQYLLNNPLGQNPPFIALEDTRNSNGQVTAVNQAVSDIVQNLYLVARKYIEIASLDDIRPASTLPVINGTQVVASNGKHSFAQVFANSGISQSVIDAGFNHYLLDNPYPHDKKPYFVNPNITELTPGICNSLQLLQQRYLSLSCQNCQNCQNCLTISFHEFLQKELLDDYKLTLVQLNDLIAKCGTTSTPPVCKFIENPINVPVALAPALTNNPDHAWVNCTRVQALITAFDNSYSGVSPTSKAYRITLTNYLNHHLGYALSFTEYMDFLQKCTNDATAVLYNKPLSPLIQYDDFGCVADILKDVFNAAGQEYEFYIESIRRQFRNDYISKCLNNDAAANLEGDRQEYHYTLYYYDQSGNLVKTIPPEGVEFLSEQDMSLIETFKDEEPGMCTGQGVPNYQNVTTALNWVSTNMQQHTANSLEMWLYNGSGTDSRQVRFTTPDKKYMVQVAVYNDRVWAEVYTLNPFSSQVHLILSKHAVADISAMTSLQPWTHIVVQSQSGLESAIQDLQIYFDGKPATNLINTRDFYPFAWEIEGTPGSFGLPANELADLKHLRLYRREATPQEIYVNYRNSCLSPVDLLAVSVFNNQGTPQDVPQVLWGRFNIPAPGSETTTGPGSITEFANRFIVPPHRLPTNYAYNSLNQVIKQNTPDAGTSEFWYDRLGRLVISQNAEQKDPAVVNVENPAGRFSYTRYDELGRIKEVGEKINSGATVDEVSVRNNCWLYGGCQGSPASWYTLGLDRQVTVTIYDHQPTWAPSGVSGMQTNLRKRVTATALLSSGNDPAVNRVSASYYSYDIAGNVKTLIQENAELAANEAQFVTGSDGRKRIDYEYDQISGKVNKVKYQHGRWDQFYYQYLYDADNRLIKALSSRFPYPDANLWTTDALYRYYLHGPLARVELGKRKVQGIDYAYTLQGWLKGVNGVELNPVKDMNEDGKSNSHGIFRDVCRDVFAFSLGYHNNDFTAIGGQAANAFLKKYTAPVLPAANASGREMFNGNIGNASYAISPIENGATAGYSYRYDQLNRLTQMNRHNPSVSADFWNNSSIISSYSEAISYDANGNIKTYNRNSGVQSNVAMDDLSYAYNLDRRGKLVNNKLRHVKDAVPASATTGLGDITDQPDNNYSYDKIGNLIADNVESINRIEWTVYGKIASVSKTGTGIAYSYDAGGNRINKKVTASDGTFTTTHYVRDAQGNTLGVYGYKANASGTLSEAEWKEQNLYGSSRLGMLTPKLVITSPIDADYPVTNDQTENDGKRLYELTNHLGNVLATISDKKIGVVIGMEDIIDHYVADVVSAQDYYPFGMLMPGRRFSATGTYRYGFNGKENDNEVKGEGNQQDYGLRIYDPRLGRFLSVDPLSKSYPWNSTYAFAENKVIHCVDLDGGEAKHYVINLNADYPVLSHYKTKDFSWIPNFLEPDVASVEVLGLNVTYTFLNASSGKNSLWSFENVFKKDPVAAIYSGEYRTDAEIMDGAVMDLAFALLAGRAMMMKGVGSNNGMSGAKFAQKKIKSDRQFSPEGQAKYSKLAGSKIKTVDDLASAIKNKKVSVHDVTVDYVIQDGEKVILNTRTSAALKQAGIPMEKWVGSDKTGLKVPGMDGKTFDDLAKEQIKRNYKPGEKLATDAPE